MKLKLNAATVDKMKEKARVQNRVEFVDEFNDFFEEVGSKFINRDSEIMQIKAALIMKEHVLLRGKPGTAKSLLARTIFHHIKDDADEKLKTFEIQFSKFMSEDYVFGPLNIKKMREDGVIEHNTKGSIVDSHFAFIDEFFDGSDVLIRSLLEVLNERTFTRNQQQIKCKLHTAILTSNFVRDDESVEAIVDRILFKANVQPLPDKTARIKMYKQYISRANNGIIKLDKTLKLSTIEKLSEELLDIEVESDILTYYDEVLKEFCKQTGKYISDRTANKCLNLIRLGALLGNKAKTSVDDIVHIKNVVVGGNKALKDDAQEATFFDVAFDKIVVTGREEILELGQIENEYGDKMVEKLRATKWESDPEKNLLKLIKEENRLIKELNEKVDTYKTNAARDALSNIVRKLQEDIGKAKAEIIV